MPDECVKTVHADGLAAYVFRVKDRVVAIAWCEGARSRKLKSAPTAQAYDIMGNGLWLKDSVLEESPVYLVGESAEAVLASLSR